ncbi:MAG: lipoprotein N-acyltransferase Lnb domain-containing protein [Phycisphaerales bacterium]
MTQPRTTPDPPATPVEPPSTRAPRRHGWIRRPIRWVVRALARLAQFLVIAWGVLAIYYSNLPWPMGRLLMAVAFGAFAVSTLWVLRARRWRWAFAAVFGAVAIWWACIPPSHDRPWRPDVATLPRAEINGDRVRLINFRNHQYRSRDDFDTRYELREIDVSRIVSVDFFISFWMPGPVGHTFLSFNFDDGSLPVCISIETRPEIGEGFDPLASMFKQFELIYVVGDERDIVRVRTDHRDEQVYLYRTRATPEAAQALFRVYLQRINELADRPEWYHLLKNNCTINIIRYSRSAGGTHARFEIRHLLNGLIDGYLHRRGIIDNSLEFSELRRRSNINDAARAAGDAQDFSSLIRKGRPGIPDAE